MSDSTLAWLQYGVVAAMIAWAAWRHLAVPALKDWIRKVAAEGKDGGVPRGQG